MDTNSTEYRIAFEQYLRRGTPLALSLKQARSTTHYIWRTRRDGKVRPSHAVNNGKIFSWDNPPSTGHPGEDYGCRCMAEPHLPETSESFDITFNNVSDAGKKWLSRDFVKHYFFGNGETITVRQTGHLRAVLAEYRRIVIDDPKRLPGQIADLARNNTGQPFADNFGRSYSMKEVVFSLGSTTITGDFYGKNDLINGMLQMRGTLVFRLRDVFRDPLDIGRGINYYKYVEKVIVKFVNQAAINIIDVSAQALEISENIASEIKNVLGNITRQLHSYIYNRVLSLLKDRKNAIISSEQKDIREIPGGTPYAIIDDWTGTFSARVHLDASRSRFKA